MPAPLTVQEVIPGFHPVEGDKKRARPGFRPYAQEARYKIQEAGETIEARRSCILNILLLVSCFVLLVYSR